MGMAAKKERGRFSLRFNIGDPVQRAAVELLELQPPHSKSQYIANAITYYNANFADDPQPLKAMAPVIDRAAIEAIVREIMRQETGSCLGRLSNGRRESGFDIKCTGAEARVYTGSGRSAGD